LGKYFGTDGFRGIANRTLTARHAYFVGRCLGYEFSKNSSHRARIVVGKDTRRSSYMLEYALAAGITASGADVYLLHVVPTPAVAYVARTEGFDCGVMISASHNPYEDNGIKIVGGNGEKAQDELILKVERFLDGGGIPLAEGEKIGRTVDYVSGRSRYLAYLLSLSRTSFRGMRVVLDCANGSAWAISKAVFDALGATVFLIGAEPDGTNINRGCGSTHPEMLQKAVVARHADVGFAFDGDADRCLCVDERGHVVDGDAMLYLFAEDLSARGELKGNAVVVTEMSNLGLDLSLKRLGISCERTQVGDRYVYEKMVECGLMLGGETSGHIIFRKLSTTGDGILAAVRMTELLKTRKCPLSCLGEGLVRFPQVLRSLYVGHKHEIVRSETVRTVKARAEATLAGGRILLRASGTESAVRILAEGEEERACVLAADEVARAVLGREAELCAES